MICKSCGAEHFPPCVTDADQPSNYKHVSLETKGTLTGAERTAEPEAREWTLCYGEYEDPAWNGPVFDGYVHVIEKSAYEAIKAERDQLRAEVKRLNKDHAWYERQVALATNKITAERDQLRTALEEIEATVDNAYATLIARKALKGKE